MTWQDLINGSFELFAGFFVIMNVRRAYLDKEIKGVSVVPMAFFTSWGYWNLYYYPHLGQWLSFVGGLSIVAVNSIWLGQAMYYTNATARRRIDKALGWARGK